MTGSVPQNAKIKFPEKPMPESEFTPFETLQRILSRWWLVVILAVLGGLLGWTFQLFHAPVYEATADLTVAMDFTKHELTQYEEDHAFSAAGAIIRSIAVQDQVIAAAQADGISITPYQLEQMTSSEGMLSAWEIHVRDQDPQLAAELVNLWAQSADEALNTALDHAVHASQLQAQITLLESCLASVPGTGLVAIPPPAPKECGRYSLAEIQTSLQAWTDELVLERQHSLGILSIMEFALTGTASIPEEPVLFDRAGLIVAGTMIGLVLGVWVTSSRKVPGSG